MTTNELIAELRQLDPEGEMEVEMEVIRTMRSDYEEMLTGHVDVVSAVKKSSACYVMRSHETMSPEEKAAARNFIHFAGN